jgi:hypothetical protein
MLESDDNRGRKEERCPHSAPGTRGSLSRTESLYKKKSKREFYFVNQIDYRSRPVLFTALVQGRREALKQTSCSDPAGARCLLHRLGGACKKLRVIWVHGAYRGQLVGWVATHFWFR